MKKDAQLASLKTRADDLVREREHMPGIKDLKKKIQKLG